MTDRVIFEGFLDKCADHGRWNNYHNGEQVCNIRHVSPTIVGTYHKQFFKIVDDR